MPGNNTSKICKYNRAIKFNEQVCFTGNWSISAKQGKITNFKTSFTKVLADGNKRHTHDLINFKQDNNTKPN